MEEHCRNGDFKRWGARGKLGNTLGSFAVISILLNIIDAQDNANAKGISLWSQMMEDMGVQIIVSDSNGNIIYKTPGSIPNL